MFFCSCPSFYPGQDPILKTTLHKNIHKGWKLNFLPQSLLRPLLHQDDLKEKCRKTTRKLPLSRSFLVVFLQFSCSFPSSFPPFSSKLGSVCKKGRKERRSFLVVFRQISGSFLAVFRKNAPRSSWCRSGLKNISSYFGKMCNSYFIQVTLHPI